MVWSWASSRATVDASVIEGNASRYHGKAPGELDWQRQKRAVAEYLVALEAEAATEGDASNDSADGGSESKPQRRYERQQPKVISPSDPVGMDGKGQQTSALRLWAELPDRY